MSRTLSPAARSAAIALAGWFALQALGCGHDHVSPGGNLPPTALLTSGPIEGDTTAYKVRLFWTGEDRDGYVAAYEVAVDPPMDLAGATWERTTDFSRLFQFTTTDAESVQAGSSVNPTGLYHGMHTVFVRAIDDEGAVSEPAHIAVTSRSVAPVTTITLPKPLDNIVLLGPALRVQWSGRDLDPAGSAPLRHEFKFVDTSRLVPPISILRITDARSILEYPGAGPWVSMGDSLSVRVSVPSRAQGVVGVRAVNAAGAAEPFFDWGRNAFKFSTGSEGSWPEITLTSELGTYFQRGRNSYTWSSRVFTNTPIHFVVKATAEAYGEEIIGWRWGVDLADLEQEVGWSPWTTNPDLPPLSFAQAGLHGFYVQVRDGVGRDNRLSVSIQAYDAPMDRAVLLVDDSRDMVTPRDSEHDAFWLSLFQDSGRFEMATDFFKYDVHGRDDVYTQDPIPPTLDQLGRYRFVVWECFGDGYNGKTGLLMLSSLSPSLGGYLSAGGQLWVDGALTVPAMIPSPNGINASFVYPKDLSAQPTSFAYRYMKLASTRVMNAKGNPRTDNLVGVIPFPGRAETYPALDQDSAKINPVKGSVSHGDAIFDPIDMAAAGLPGVIDSLYVYQAKSATSAYQNKLSAVRWHDPDPAREQGRTQWFGFQLYYMKKEQAQETFNRSIDWFREEVRP